MNRRGRRWLGIVALAVALGGAPAAALAGASGDSLLELASGRGPSLGFGFGLSSLHWDPIAPPAPGARAAESTPLLDPEPRSQGVSLDIKLRWPGTEAPSLLEPYLVFGPALFVERPSDAMGLAGLPGDPVLRLGAKAGAGFNWRLGKDTTLFGSYDITTTDVGGLMSPGARTPATSGVDGYDVLYGVRFRY